MIPAEFNGCAGIGRGQQDSTDPAGKIVGRNWHQCRDVESDNHRSWDRSTSGVHHESNGTDFFGVLLAAGRRTGGSSRIVRSRGGLAVDRKYQIASLDAGPGDCSADGQAAETSSGIKNPAQWPGSSTRERISSLWGYESLDHAWFPAPHRKSSKPSLLEPTISETVNASPGADES